MSNGLGRLPGYRDLFSFFVVLLILQAVPSHAISEPYENLKNALESAEPVDTALIRKLPTPRTAEEYHLRSRVRTTTNQALDDLRRSLELQDGPKPDVLLNWINLALLMDPSSERLETLKSFISTFPRGSHDRVWLIAGKYAAYNQRYSLAIRWGQRAIDADETRPEALLDLAEYEYHRRRYPEARRHLQRHLLEYPSHDRPRHWTLEGRVMRANQSDSEAYLAYSHIIRNYPKSLELSEAERAVSELPLPATFRPSKTRRGKGDRVKSSTSGKANSADDQAKLQLGSFLSRERAESFRTKMSSKLEQKVIITSVSIDGRTYHRVQVAGLGSKYEAEALNDKLKRQGIDAFIVDD